MSDSNNLVYTPKAPLPIGPYSQAIITDRLVFCSGQIAIDPVTSEFMNGSIKDQTIQVLKNISEVLLAAGSRLDQVIKTTIFLKDLTTFGDVNQVYADFFKPPFPARSTVEVSRLPKDALVEIEVIAKVF